MAHTLILEGVALAARMLAIDPDTDAAADLDGQWMAWEARLRLSDQPLARLAKRLELTSFDLRTLGALLGMHVEPAMARLVAQVEDQPVAVGLTVRAVIRAFAPTASQRLLARRRFLPGAPLADRHIVTLGVLEGHSEDGLLDRPLLLSGPAVRYCLDEPGLPAVRQGLYRIETPDTSLFDVVLPADRLETVRRLARGAVGRRGSSALLVLVSGPAGTGKSMLSKALANHLSRPLLTLRAGDLPMGAGLVEALRDTLTDAWLSDALVVLDGCDAVLSTDDPRCEVVLDTLAGFEGAALLLTDEPRRLDPGVEQRVTLHLPITRPDATMRHQIWEVHLPADLPLADGVDLGSLATRFDFVGATIRSAVDFATRIETDESSLTQRMLEEACRAQVAGCDGELTVRTEGEHGLADIVLPQKARKAVEELVAACRNHATVLDRWGFGRRLTTGRGIVALFDGPPGTGKTFCAEILASELRRPLHRVNVAEVVSKWAGETEKHIRQVFQQARINHGVLLFDEADALFSSRVSETRSAADRHANMEVNLLLQEIERFGGICILTTNFFGNLDRALVRRIQFRVRFEEPSQRERAAIWGVLCPPEAPRSPDVDFADLACEYELTGAQIKNALLRAAYRACDAQGPLTQQVLESACRDEYAAAGKLWVPPSMGDEFKRRAAL